MLRKISKENTIERLIALQEIKNAKDFEYAIQMTRWLLQPLGLWPMKTSTFATVVRPFFIILCAFLLMFLLIPICLHMFFIEKDLGIRLKLIGPVSFVVMNIFKFFAMLFKENDVASCVVDIATDWHEVEGTKARNCMLKNAKIARYFTTICVIFMFGGGLPYSTIVPLTRPPIVVGNVTYRHLAYPCYFIFFNPRIRPIYDIVFVMHCICNFAKYLVTCGVCSYTIMCIMHICGQCNITMATLKAISGSLDKKTLGKIVKQHLRSMKFATKLEDILNDMCLVEMVGCTFNMCMLGYYFITEYENRKALATVTYLLLFISFTFNIFIFCYIGEILTEKCENIGEVAYMINWYELSSNEARCIILIVASTQRPVAITAGKMVTLSITSFCNVIKASVTYLNMLRTLTANET